MKQGVLEWATAKTQERTERNQTDLPFYSPLSLLRCTHLLSFYILSLLIIDTLLPPYIISYYSSAFTIGTATTTPKCTVSRSLVVVSPSSDYDHFFKFSRWSLRRASTVQHTTTKHDPCQVTLILFQTHLHHDTNQID